MGFLAWAFQAGDIARTQASDNKASAFHFLHFDFSPAAIAEWRSGAGTAMLVIDQPNYGHAALIAKGACRFLANECF